MAGNRLISRERFHLFTINNAIAAQRYFIKPETSIAVRVSAAYQRSGVVKYPRKDSLLAGRN
jgi:hypothetical protein